MIPSAGYPAAQTAPCSNHTHVHDLCRVVAAVAASAIFLKGVATDSGFSGGGHDPQVGNHWFWGIWGRTDTASLTVACCSAFMPCMFACVAAAKFVSWMQPSVTISGGMRWYLELFTSGR